MRVHWQGSVEVDAPIDWVYRYLSDFTRHPEWSQTIERIELVRRGDERGAGAIYKSHERVAFPDTSWSRLFSHATTAETICEVRALSPNHRIVWHAHPNPPIGGADLSFELRPTPTGGTLITQTVDEHYLAPIAAALRLAMNVTPRGIERQLEHGLETLREAIERQADPVAA